jgi:hypothetical protein
MPLNAGLPAVPVSGWDVRAGRWITTTADKQTNQQINTPSAVLDHQFFINGSPSQGHDEETFHLSDSPRRDVDCNKTKVWI